MSIWTYTDDTPSDSNTPSELAVAFGKTVQIPDCPFCSTGLVYLYGRDLPKPAFGCTPSHQKAIQVCQSCGWWVVFHVSTLQTEYDSSCVSYRRVCGTLKNLDLSDLSLPTEDLRKYLIAKYDDRYVIHPKKFEDIVGSVFSDYGYHIRVTSFSGDEGIDVVILDGDGGETAGIQVKRYSGKIGAEQIRSFTGALHLKGMTSGIFVTTSSFTKGAQKTVNLSQARGLPIELMDAKRFYEALQITQRPEYESSDDPSAPFFARWRNVGSAPVVVEVAW